MPHSLVDEDAHLSYQGADTVKYIPVDQEAELNLGPTARMTVEPTLMKQSDQEIMFHPTRGVIGFERLETWRVEVKNTRDVPVRVEVRRNLRHQHWTLKRSGDFGDYEKVDMDSIRFTLDLEPRSQRDFAYTVTYSEGERRNRR